MIFFLKKCDTRDIFLEKIEIGFKDYLTFTNSSHTNIYKRWSDHIPGAIYSRYATGLHKHITILIGRKKNI